MKDKLHFKKKPKRPRVNWIKVVAYLGLEDYFLLDDDESKSKIRSLNRRTFNWFLSRFGRKYVKYIREHPSNFYLNDQLLSDVSYYKDSHPNISDFEMIERIARTEWIQYPEED